MERNCEMSNLSHLRKLNPHPFTKRYCTFLICAFLVVRPAYTAGETIFNCNSLDEVQADEVLIKCPPSNKEIKSRSAEPSTTSYASGTCTCIFHRRFTRKLPSSSGPKFVRLYFTQYPDFNTSKARFTVRLGKYTLLQTSNYSYAAYPSTKDYIIREFIVNMGNPMPNITFIPSPNFSESCAFVNKIEVVSIPLDLYTHNTQLPLVGRWPLQSYTGDWMALETMYRANVGGPSISPEDETSMSRLWMNDNAYFIDYTGIKTIIKSEVEIKYSAKVPTYTAPKTVYSTARVLSPEQVYSPLGHVTLQGNISWSFLVESGFYYLIRFHFCEIRKNLTWDDGKYFHIYINNKIAEDHANVISWSSGTGKPVYKDYVVKSSTHDQATESLLISLHVDTKLGANFAYAILNGLEIFKLPDSTGNLAGMLPFGTQASYIEHSRTFGKIIKGFPWLVLFLFSSCLFLYITVSRFQIWFLYLRVRLRSPSQESDGCRQFSLTTMKLATNNFSDSFLIGTGGFGKVYKGVLEKDDAPVAIKRANPNSHQGLHEFQTEISMLSKLRHRHLVSLIGYCMEGKEMILVYKFMEHGTLRDHLYNSQNPPLHWIQRLKICIGAARGLHYLHTGSKQTIIHRDVKTTNILLDNEWEAKVSDFGLSKFGPDMINQSHTHVSTMVKGSIGYLDPEYYRRMKLTEKSDVYSFGVMLLEVLCAKPAILPIKEHEDEAINLAALALKCHREGTWDRVIDPILIGKIDPECFRTFTNVAKRCLAEKGCERPSMGEVLSSLELALQQQRYVNRCCRSPNTVCALNPRTIIDHNVIIGTSNSDQHLGIEFSEIIYPSAR